jgi:hypothetical protein
MPTPSRDGLPSRRSVLKWAGLTGALTVAATPVLQALAEPALAGTRAWSDPATWGGKVPGRADVARVTGVVVLDVDAHVAGVVIEPEATLIFDPSASRALNSDGNVVVRGDLRMKPANNALSHRLVFPTVKEAAFVGGGMDVVDSDTGLWVMGIGRLSLVGAARLPWVRTAVAVPAGATFIDVAADPTGWQVGDELAITPTLPPTHPQFSTAYDVVRITGISARRVSLSRPVTYAHPSRAVGRGTLMMPEVLNLTRNVSVEGTAAGRAHIFVHSNSAQTIMHTQMRHLGPRQPDGKGYTTKVLGRYGLHFHIAGEGVAGSMVAGAVARDGGSHAFVSHESHGVSYVGCIAHDVYEDAYWYDLPPDTRVPGRPVNRLRYEGCIASLVRCDPNFRGYRLTGFLLGAGAGNVAKNCVAVGVQGNLHASGFHWPENSIGVWSFESCVSHNNKCNGIFTWHNTDVKHVIEEFIGYHNGLAGISHGAYVNPYIYRNTILTGNRECGLEIHSLSHGLPQRFEGLLIDASGLSKYAVTVVKHTLSNRVPTELVRCTMLGYTVAGIGFIYDGANGASQPEQFDLIDCTFSGNEVWMDSRVLPESVVRIQDPIRGTLLLRRADQVGTYRPNWNARVSAIAKFAAASPPAPTTPIIVAESAPQAPVAEGVFRTRALRPATCVVPEVLTMKMTRRSMLPGSR